MVLKVWREGGRHRVPQECDTGCHVAAKALLPPGAGTESTVGPAGLPRAGGGFLPVEGLVGIC